MKKIFPAVFLMVCLLLTSCGSGKTAFPATIDAFVEIFNERAADTDYALGKTAEAADGTITVATKNENSSVFCTEAADGALTKIEVEGAGIYQPGLASFDYMVYAVIACDGSLDYQGAGDMIASMYYEAYTGGEPVVAAYNGIQYSFLKESYYCMLTIEATEG